MTPQPTPQKQDRKTTWAGIFALIIAGLNVTNIAISNPVALTDPQLLTSTAATIATAIGLIKAADSKAK